MRTETRYTVYNTVTTGLYRGALEDVPQALLDRCSDQPDRDRVLSRSGNPTRCWLEMERRNQATQRWEWLGRVPRYSRLDDLAVTS